ncbi:MAG: PD-(D/E)XK nuclease family protein [Bacillota bacterium]
MIKFLIGKSLTGKTYKILDEITSDKLNKNIYLVPEQFNLEAERKLIKHKNLDGLLNIDCISFKWLTKKIISKVGGLDEVEIDEFGKTMVLKNILTKSRKELKYFKKNSFNKGTIDKFINAFSKFKLSNLEYEKIKNIFENDEIDPYLKIKSKDILKIYKSYINFMKNNYFDDEDRLKFVLKKIDELKYFEDKNIWIDEFHGFNELQKELIKKMFIQGKNVTISLNLDPKFNEINQFKNVRQTFIELQDLCKKNNLDYKIVEFNERYIENDEIKTLSNNLYKFPNKVYKKELENIKGFISKNKEEEVEQIAIEMNHLIRNNKNLNWSDINVVLSDLSEYKLFIKKIFKQYNIPYFIDEKISIINNSIIEFIISVLKMINGNFRDKDVFTVIKTNFSKLDKDEGEILENYVKEYGIYGNLWKKDFTRGKKEFDNDKGINKEKLKEINRIRKKFINPFLELNKNINKKNIDVSKFTIYYYEFLKDYGLIDSLEKWILKLRINEELEKVNENTQIWNIVMKVIEQLVELFNDKGLNLSEYIKILKQGFLEYEVGILPSLDDKVIVGDVHRTKLSDVKILFILGINDGNLPKTVENKDIFSKDEKMYLKENGLDLKLDIDYKINEENYNIYKLFSKPQNKLYLSYALSNNEGKSLRPSILIDKVKSIFPNIKFRNIINSTKKTIVTQKSSLKYLIYNLRRKVDGYEIDDYWYKVYNWYLSNYLKEDNWIKSALFYDNSIETIGKDFAKQIYDLPLVTSVTQLEKFQKCPFSHFIKYGLKPKEIKDFEIELPDLGLMFHKALENFSKLIKEKNLKWDNLTKKESDKYVKDIINNLTKNYSNNIFDDNYRNKYYKQKIARVVKRSVWTLRNHIIKGNFSPTSFEVNFSQTKKGLNPIVINLNEKQKLILEGKIDRLDILDYLDKKYLKVIDYKSGNPSLKLSNIYNGEKIQLVIYLKALLNDPLYFQSDKTMPAGIYNFQIDDPIVDFEKTEDLDKKLIQKMKMDGISLDDIEIVKRIDENIEKNNESDIIDVKLKKNGDFYARSKVLSEKNFKRLLKHVETIVKNTGDKIVNGSCQITPLKMNSNYSACDFCDYKGICQFDKKIKGNEFKENENLKDKEVIKKLEKYGDKND